MLFKVRWVSVILFIDIIHEVGLLSEILFIDIVHRYYLQTIHR